MLQLWTKEETRGPDSYSWTYVVQKADVKNQEFPHAELIYWYAYLNSYPFAYAVRI